MIKSADEIAKALGWANCSDPRYFTHAHSVKHEFLDRDYPQNLVGPDVLRRQKGGKYLEEKAIEELFEAYEDIWDIEKFGGDYSKRHAFARDFINTQTKKYRSARSKEQNKVAAAAKRAEATAKRARARPPTTPVQKAQGRKRTRVEASSSRQHSSPFVKH